MRLANEDAPNNDVDVIVDAGKAQRSPSRKRSPTRQRSPTLCAAAALPAAAFTACSIDENNGVIKHVSQTHPSSNEETERAKSKILANGDASG